MLNGQSLEVWTDSERMMVTFSFMGLMGCTPKVTFACTINKMPTLHPTVVPQGGQTDRQRGPDLYP